jgi:ABC-type transport system involved in multi-copper enzyme maturation permease subunit
MSSNISIIGLKEFRDRLRSGWVIACALVWLAVISLTSIFGLIQIGHIGVQGYERTTISLLNLVQYLVPLLGLLVGHDLIVREREDRTLNLIVAAGVSRARVMAGKFIGGALTVTVPLVLGFVIAGLVIGLAARDRSFAPLLKLAISGVVLGVAFCGIGLVVSTFARTRVQALVLALLCWGIAVFAFDLAALGIIVSTKAAAASHEIDLICDATHVNSQADIHAAFDSSVPTPTRAAEGSASYFWLWFNPVDVFRMSNLPSGMAVPVSLFGAVVSVLLWIAFSLGLATWRFRRIDL